MTQPELQHGQLFCRGPTLMLNNPSGLNLSAELYLWRHEQDRMSAVIHYREQHDHLLAAINYFADADAQAVPFDCFCFNSFSIHRWQRCTLLALEQNIQRWRRRCGRQCLGMSVGRSRTKCAWNDG